MCYSLAIMERKLIGLTDEQWKQLKALSTKTGAPLSALVRLAVKEYLKKQK